MVHWSVTGESCSAQASPLGASFHFCVVFTFFFWREVVPSQNFIKLFRRLLLGKFFFSNDPPRAREIFGEDPAKICQKNESTKLYNKKVSKWTTNCVPLLQQPTQCAIH